MHDINLVHGGIKGVGSLVTAWLNASDTELDQHLDLKWIAASRMSLGLWIYI